MSELEQEDQVRASMRAIATSAAREAVREMLTHLGIDAQDPIKTQAEFQAVRSLAALMKDEQVAEDMAFVRRLRGATETIKETTLKSIVRWVVPVLLGLLVLGTKDWWLAHIRG